jgi:ferritin-like metal-binding protein YciE
MTSLDDAFIAELQDLLNAERQISKALPKMAKKASSEELRQAFEQHLEQTEEHIARLEQALESLGKSARGKKCDGMQGIIDEGKHLMEQDVEDDVLDAVMIAAAQKVEHYEIAAYGTMCTWAKTLGHDDVCDLLKQTLSEEKETDQKLTQIAEQSVNREAMHA